MSSIAQTGPADVLAANLQKSAQADAVRQRLRHKDPNAFTLLLNGYEVPVTAAKCKRAIDEIASGWTAEVPWTPGADANVDRSLALKSYTPAQVFLGPNLWNTGRVYTIENVLEKAGRVKNIEGWSSTKDLVDSTIPWQVVQRGAGNYVTEGNYQWVATPWMGNSVWNFCKSILPATGIDVVTDLGDNKATYTYSFPMIQCEVTETYAEVITRYSFAAGLLATDDMQGRLFLTQAHVGAAPVGTLKEGDPLVTDWKIKIDGTRLFFNYNLYGEAGDGIPPIWVVRDDGSSGNPDSPNTNPPTRTSSVPTFRSTSVRSGELDFSQIRVAALWKLNQQIIKALSFSLPVSSWYAPNGTLWQPNTMVQVVSDTLELPSSLPSSKSTFVIREVDFDYSKSGCTAVLHLVPPLAYSTSPVNTQGVPWR